MFDLFRLRPVTWAPFAFVALLAPAMAQDDFQWCGNHIFDPKKPSGLSDWAMFRQMQSNAEEKSFPRGATTSESEPNNTRQTGTLIDVSSGAATVTGVRDIPVSPPAPSSFSATENNDSIPAASATNLATGTTSGRKVTNARIGDGQFGATSGDFDFHAFAASPGDLILVDVTSAGVLDPVAAIYNGSGQMLAFRNDETPGSAKKDPYFVWTPEAAGTYYLAIGGYAREPVQANFPQNPLTAGTGQGAGSTGFYDLTIHRLTPSIAAFEENGTIGTAIPFGNTAGALMEFSLYGYIGDNPVISGDFDMFSFQAASGQSFTFDSTTPDPSAAGLDPVLGIYDFNGNLIAAHADENAQQGASDALLSFTAPSAGTYYLIIGAQLISEAAFNFPDNPFIGIGAGQGSFGYYTIIASSLNTDPDWLQMDLEIGDVLSARVTGGAMAIGSASPDGTNRTYTINNTNAFSAPGSPFPKGGVSFSYVVPATGRYGIELLSAGTLVPDEAWQVDIVVSEPGMRARTEGSRQIVFLDFNGAVINPSIFGGPNEDRTLTPLAGFLADWGLQPNQESLVIDKIIATMEENLIADMAARGGNGNYVVTGIHGQFALTFLNSRDHADPWGQPNVSRLIFGGTTAQLGIETIGIAQSIDPGNYAIEESAVVLLDKLSGNDGNSLNQYLITGGRTKADLVGVGVGNIASHEIGHFVGSWHTVNSNGQLNIMDQGGNLAGTLGIGADLTFGSGDDLDVDFTQDVYEPKEVYFQGSEDTLRATAFGLSTGRQPVAWSGSYWIVR